MTDSTPTPPPPGADEVKNVESVPAPAPPAPPPPAVVAETPAPPPPVAPDPVAVDPHRRDLMKKTAAVAVGATIVTVPTIAGLMTLLDPLGKNSGAAGFIKITSLESLPDDGMPRKFQVVADRTDAWNKYRAVPIGAVYLRREGQKVTAFNAVCPHAGCFVDTVADGSFKCPCHNSGFNKDGSLAPNSVSPRGMDELEVDPQALKSGDVMVKYQDFLAGTHEKVPRG